MNRPVAVVLAGLLAAATGSTYSAQSRDLVAHEWGTFTSVAGEDGQAVEWLPLGGPTDLPCFVNRFREYNLKFGLSGTVRMETPVVYLYAGRETAVDVDVAFRQGLMTEWFPRAAAGRSSIADYRKRGSASTLAWSVKVMPGAPEVFRGDGTDSHYYAARETDAAPLRTGADSEKFLFYRGVGGFAPPLVATVSSDGSVRVKNTGADALPTVILFENRGGERRFQVHRGLHGEMTFHPSVLDDELPSAAHEIERALLAEGLYPKEATAMIKTWGDSWFEEGSRLFYLVPRATVDAVLPLRINPMPVETVRAFVGRMELITPIVQREVEGAVARDDRATLSKYGRFLQPIGARILAGQTIALDRKLIEQRLMAAYPPEPLRAPGCS